MRKKYFFYVMLLSVVSIGYGMPSVVPNEPPTITAIANQSACKNSSISNLAFTIADAETAVADLTVTATSTNEDLLPVSNIVFGGSDSDRTVTLTPVMGMVGTSEVTITVTDGNAATATTTVTVVIVQNGDPAVFGTNQWNVYVYNSTDDTFPVANYRGVYTQSGVSFNTDASWDRYFSPSGASGYTGCPVPEDYHSYQAKRKGFPEGCYTINILGHDDSTELFIDGVSAFSHDGCCDSHYGVWTGILNADSEVVIATLEGGGASYSNYEFVLNTVTTPVGGMLSADQTITCGIADWNIALSGYSGTILKWQKASDAAFTSQEDIYYGEGIYNGETMNAEVLGNLDATTYFRAVVGNGCSSVYSSIASVTVVEAPPLLTDFSNIKGYLVYGTTVLDNPTSDSAGAFTFTSSDPSVATIDGNTVTFLTGGQTIITATQAASGCFTEATVTCVLTVVDCQLTTITAQPVSQTGVCAGTDTSFSVEATGDALTYQWRKGEANIEGATSATLMLTNVTPADAVSYTCEIAGTCPTVVSNAVTLTLETVSPTALAKNITVALDELGYVKVDASQLDNGSTDNCNGDLKYSFYQAATGMVCATTWENGQLELSAPEGTEFTGVTFASYGTPEGECGNFTYGECHAENSISIVSSYIVGKKSAIIPATNDVFEDPCGGTGKKLYVQATYGPSASTAVTSRTFNCSNIGSNEVMFFVTDASGNVSSQTATVTVVGDVVHNIMASEGAGQVYTTGSVIDTDLEINQTFSVPGASVMITEGFQPYADTLYYNGVLPDGVMVNYYPDKGKLVFVGTMEPSVAQSVLRGVAFSTTSGNLQPRKLTFSLGTAVSNPINGHYYEYVEVEDGISWADAKVAAQARTFYGIPGYLATATSAQENNFMVSKLTGDGWLGGSDRFSEINEAAGTTLYPNQDTSEGKWYWVTGPEKGQQFSENNFEPVTLPGKFAKWSWGEPNNSDEEDYLQIYFGNDGMWNDLNGEDLNGYIVEYGGLNNAPCLLLSTEKTINIVYNNVPNISGVDNQQSCIAIQDRTLNLNMGDEETPADDLVLSASSSNPAVLSADNISFSGTGNERTLTFTTQPNIFGSSVVTVTVTDAVGGKSTTEFTVLIGDTNKPNAVAKDITVILDENGQAVVTPAMIDNESTDDCAIANYKVVTGNPISSKIYFTGSDGKIWEANRDGSGMPKALYDYHNNLWMTVGSIEVDLTHQQLYFGANWNNAVYKVLSDGKGEIESVPNTSQYYGQVNDLELDMTGNKLFYTLNYPWEDYSFNGIYVTSGDGSVPAVQLVTDAHVESITFDKTHQKVYFTKPNGIGVVNADGTDVNTNLFAANNPVGITINETSGRLFWVAQSEKKIYTVLADGSEEPHVLYSFAQDDNYVNNGYGIDYDATSNMLFWTAYGNNNDDTVYTAPADGSGTPKILFKGDFGQIRGVAAGRNIHGASLDQPKESVVYTGNNVGTQNLYLVVTDTSGNVSYAPAKVTVVGEGVVTATCPSAIIQNAVAGNCSAPIETPNPAMVNMENLKTLTWNISGATTASSSVTGINYVGAVSFNKGVSTVTYTATSNSGIVYTCSFTVTVNDNEAPAAIAKNVTVYLDKTGNATLTAGQVDNGSTDNCGTVTAQLATDKKFSSKIYFGGSNGYVWSANRDGSGTPTVLYDYHDENMNGSVNGVEVDNDGEKVYFSNGWRGVSSSSLGGNGVVSNIPNTNPNYGNTDVELDLDGNRMFYTDINNGVYSINADGSVSSAQLWNGYGVEALAFDKTHQKIYFSNSDNGSIGVMNADGTNANDHLFNANYPRGITIDEASGRIFWIEQDTKKIYTALADGSEAPHALYTFAKNDDYVNQGYGIDYDPATNMLFWTARSWYESDDVVYSAPADGTGTPKELFRGNFGQITGIAAGRNIHGGDTAINTDSIQYTTNDVGVHTEYLVVTDAAGNMSKVEVTVTVAIPSTTITCPEPIAVNVDAGLCGASIAVVNPEFSNVDVLKALTWKMTGDTVAESAETGVNYVGTTVFNTGTTTVEYTAVDVNDNVVTCSFAVTVTDNELPIVITKNITVQLGENGVVTVNAEDVNDGSSDNCEIDTMELSKTIFTCKNVGDNEVTLTVTDKNGNVSSENAIVTIGALPTVQPIAGDAGVGVAATITLGSETAGGVWSSSDEDVVTVDPSTGEVTGVSVGTAEITYTVTFGECELQATKGITVSNLANDQFDLSKLSFYPNPVKDVLNVSYGSDMKTVSVINLLGQELMSQTVNGNLARIDMSKLPNAAYLIKVNTDNAVKIIKVIKD